MPSGFESTALTVIAIVSLAVAILTCVIALRRRK
jgi:hypothetical protein